MNGALNKIRVLDLTRVLAGPYCTMMLADMGAEVIKIEIPDSGDDSRAFGPYRNGSSLYFANVNRNKKGVTLNLKTPEGRDLFLKMAETADVVVENYRPGVMDKLGVGYDVLKKVNPRIIYGAVSGFGYYGPYSDRPGYDIIAQAMGGFMSLNGPRGGQPTKSGCAMGDVLGGLNLTIGILAALNSRRDTGLGQRVDVALADSVVSCLENLPQWYFESGQIPARMGNWDLVVYPYDSYRAKDKEVIIGCGNQRLYERLVALMKMPELLADPRFATLEQRNKPENREVLGEIINGWTQNYQSDELVKMILGVGVPAAPILDMKDVTEDEHIAKVRQMFVELDHPVIGKMKVNGNPVKLVGTPVEIKRHAPATPGQDNEEVYEGVFGLSASEVAELKVKGVL